MSAPVLAPKRSRLSPIADYLIVCANADVETTTRTGERGLYAALGAAVLTTASLGCLTLAMAWSIIASGWASLLAVPLGLGWGIALFCFDRGVVLGMPPDAKSVKDGQLQKRRSTSPYLGRIILSVIFGLVISDVACTALFAADIQGRMAQTNMATANNAIASQNAALQSRTAASDAALQRAQDRVNELIKEINYWQQQVDCEEQGTCGTGVPGRGDKWQEKQSFLTELRTQLTSAEEAAQAARRQNGEDRQAAGQTSEEAINSRSLIADIQNANGFLGRHEAMYQLLRSEPGAAIGFFLLTLLIMIIDLMPMIGKITSSRSLYENERRAHAVEFRHRTAYGQRVRRGLADEAEDGAAFEQRAERDDQAEISRMERERRARRRGIAVEIETTRETLDRTYDIAKVERQHAARMEQMSGPAAGIPKQDIAGDGSAKDGVVPRGREGDADDIHLAANGGAGLATRGPESRVQGIGVPRSGGGSVVEDNGSAGLSDDVTVRLPRRDPRQQTRQGKGFAGRTPPPPVGKGGRYVAERLMPNQGSQGETWLGHDRMTGQAVVIKATTKVRPSGRMSRLNPFNRSRRPGPPGPVGGDTFPNVCEILWYGESGNQLFQVSPLYKPGSLAEWLSGPDGGSIAVASLLRMIEDVLLGLASAPEWVHLDIKPANLFLDGIGIRVGDWGAAKLQARLMSGLTAVPGGTRAYVSPEQLAAWDLRNAIVGGRSAPRLALMDLFSVGIVAFELAIGAPAYSREFEASPGFAARWARSAVESPRIDSYIWGCPNAVSDLFAAWISTEPGRRIGRHVDDVIATALFELQGVRASLAPEDLQVRVGRDHVVDSSPHRVTT